MPRCVIIGLLLVCPSPAAQAALAGNDFAGAWDTTYGRMVLKQDGPRVSGTYLDDKATLDGTVEGPKLTFTYREPGKTGEGWFKLTADGQSFGGLWRPEGAVSWSAWLGKRQVETATPPSEAGSFAGTWQTDFGPLELKQTRDRIEGTYYNGSAKVAGRVSGDKLTFTFHEPSGSGDGVFVLAADGRSFTGQWHWTGQATQFEWNGHRPGAAPHQAESLTGGFDGLWNSTFGRIRLLQRGDRVEGTYAYADGSSITGRVQGNRLEFKYQEPAAAGEGRFELSDDGQSFTGRWRAEGQTQWQSWDGTRVEPIEGRMWLVVIEARWESNLEEQEYTFGDMLRSFFTRSPHVEVRHRFFNDEAGLKKWCRELAYLGEPIVLSISSHGSPQGVSVGGLTVGPQAIGESLRYASTLKLVHFSACQTMQGNLPGELLAAMGDNSRVPISGYTKTVDWAASAVLEFMYFDLVLSRRMAPQRAAQQVRLLMPFAAEQLIPGSSVAPTGFRLHMPAATPATAAPPQHEAAGDLTPAAGEP